MTVHASNNAKPFSDTHYYTVSEVADALGCAKSTIRRHINNGQLPKMQPRPHMRILISGAELNHFYARPLKTGQHLFSSRAPHKRGRKPRSK